MKVIDSILLNEDFFNPDEIENNVAKLASQIEFNKTSDVPISGVSLLAVRDLLPQFSDEFLHSQGYILTIADFKKECEQVAYLVKEDPIRYNSRSKRVHYTYNTFVKHYINGKIQNKVALDEMIEHFSAVIQRCYQDYGTKDKLMVKNLYFEVSTLITNQLEVLTKSWLHNELTSNLQEEFSHQFSKQLLTDWQQNKLDLDVKKQLEDQLAASNSIGSLLDCFRNNRLPNSIQEKIKKNVVRNIVADILIKRLQGTSLLGELIAKMRAVNINGKSSIVHEIIQHWQEKKITGETAQELEHYIAETIEVMNLKDEQTLASQFTEFVAQTFVKKISLEDYPENIRGLIFKLALEFAKDNIAYTRTSKTTMPMCSESVYSDVMHQLHELWITQKLTPSNSSIIKELVLDDLKRLYSTVSQCIWQNKSTAEMTKMRTELNELAKLVRELSRSLQKDQQPTPFVNEKNTDQATLLSNFGLYNTTP